jgi:hypothetical protein
VRNFMRRVLTLFLTTLMVLGTVADVRPYSTQRADRGSSTQLKWPNRTINFALSTSILNPPPNVKAGNDLLSAVRRALAHWSEQTGFRFVETISSTQSVSNGSGDGISLITIANTPENIALFGHRDETGKTRVFFTDSGLLTEADIVLNPNQPFSTDGTVGSYDFQSAVTHEIGHALGLDHTSLIGATMQPRQGRNGLYGQPALFMRTLSEDDRSGIRALYSRTGTGSIAGQISGASTAIDGASVWAEEVATGRVAATAITNSRGAYRIQGLLPGEYRVVVEPLNSIGRELYSRFLSHLSRLVPFRTTEIGTVTVKEGTTTTLGAQLRHSVAFLEPAMIGLNSQLSMVPVTVSPGGYYTVHLAGFGLYKNWLSNSAISVSSSAITVDQPTLTQLQSVMGLSQISFGIYVNPNATPGDYSIRLQSNTGEISYYAGALTVEGSNAALASDIGSMSEQKALIVKAGFQNIHMLDLCNSPSADHPRTVREYRAIARR